MKIVVERHFKTDGIDQRQETEVATNNQAKLLRDFRSMGLSGDLLQRAQVALATIKQGGDRVTLKGDDGVRLVIRGVHEAAKAARQKSAEAAERFGLLDGKPPSDPTPQKAAAAAKKMGLIKG